METGSDDGHFMALRGPVTLRHMRFRLTDLDGNVVRPRIIKKDGADRTRGAGGARGARGATTEAPHAAPHAAQDAAPEPKRRGRPPGSKNKPTEPAAPKGKPKPSVETTPAEAPEAPLKHRLHGGASAHKRAAHAGEAVRL